MSKEININSIINQVKRNCNISDAKEDPNTVESHFFEHLYRYENKVTVEHKINKKHFNIWLKRKKDLWVSLRNKRYGKIIINNKKFDISDNLGINKILIPNGLFYRMKDSVFGRPSFLLAKILKKERRGKYKILILEEELARDLRTSYYSQCELLYNIIFCRYEAERFCFFELIKEMNQKPKGKNKIIFDTLERIGLDSKNSERINRIMDGLVQTHIAHEFGHAATRDKGIFPNKLFMYLVENYKDSDIEWFIKAIHEVSADVITDGRLSYIIKKQSGNLFSLYAYELLSQYQTHPILKFKMKLLFGNSDNLKNILQSVKLKKWKLIEEKRINTYERVVGIVEKLKEIKANKNEINALIRDYDP